MAALRVRRSGRRVVDWLRKLVFGQEIYEEVDYDERWFFDFIEVPIDMVHVENGELHFRTTDEKRNGFPTGYYIDGERIERMAFVDISLAGLHSTLTAKMKIHKAKNTMPSDCKKVIFDNDSLKALRKVK